MEFVLLIRELRSKHTGKGGVLLRRALAKVARLRAAPQQVGSAEEGHHRPSAVWHPTPGSAPSVPYQDRPRRFLCQVLLAIGICPRATMPGNHLLPLDELTRARPEGKNLSVG